MDNEKKPSTAQTDKVKRDIAYVIKGIRAKKRLQNDFEPRTSREHSPDLDLVIEEEGEERRNSARKLSHRMNMREG